MIDYYYNELLVPMKQLLLFCGESGIRTRGTLLEYTHFPGVLLKPLGHLSNVSKPLYPI